MVQYVPWGYRGIVVLYPQVTCFFRDKCSDLALGMDSIALLKVYE